MNVKIEGFFLSSVSKSKLILKVSVKNDCFDILQINKIMIIPYVAAATHSSSKYDLSAYPKHPCVLVLGGISRIQFQVHQPPLLW